MSLSITLYYNPDSDEELGPREKQVVAICETAKEVGLSEWALDDLQEWLEDRLGARLPREEVVFEANITHNLAPMAKEAGCYQEMWRPDEVGIKTASEVLPALQAAAERLRANPDHFRKLNPKNGWGSYEDLLVTITEYLKACKQYPDAFVRACG